MDNSLAIGLATQKLLQQRMDVTANNLANVDTTGFKVESVIARQLEERPASTVERPNDVSFAESWQLQRDMRTGPLERTGNPLDVAIAGEGFFSIGGVGEDTLYTRDGSFNIDENGRLVSRTGLPVLGQTANGDGAYVEGAGGEIIIDEALGPVTITQAGAIMQGNNEIARLDIVAFDTPAALEKRGGNLLAATDEQPREPVNLRVEQGQLEGSNVQAVLELTRMIDIPRTYQSVAKMISEQNNMREQAISKLARLR